MIGLCDCNSFYASSEQLFRPDLRSKGVLVLSNNDGVVIALNAKAKELGFKRGDLYHKIIDEAKKKDCTFFSSNYALYANLSTRVINCLNANTEEVIPYSIDEAFFIPMKNQDCVELRNLVSNQTGLPVSIGLARTKTLAKIANHIGKKMTDGACVIKQEDEEEILRKTLVEEIWGIGYKTAEKLRRKGITTALSFAMQDEGWIKSNYNITVLKTARELKGIPCIEEGETDKSFCSGISFKAPITNFDELYTALCAQAQVLSLKLEQKNLVSSTFVISIFNSRFQEGFYAPFEVINFEEQTNYLPKIIQAVYIALKKIYVPNKYKGCRIFAINLYPKGTFQYSLFQSESDIASMDKRDKLTSVVQEISKKYGRTSIVPATMLGIDKTNLCKRELKSPAYTTNFNELPTVN